MGNFKNKKSQTHTDSHGFLPHYVLVSMLIKNIVVLWRNAN